MDNAGFVKNMENVRNHRSMKLVKTEKKAIWSQNQIIVKYVSLKIY